MNAPSLTSHQLSAIRATAVAQRHPRLLWSTGDRDAILDRIATSGPCRAMADQLRAKCDAYLDRAHAQHLDLEACSSQALFDPPNQWFYSRIMEELAFAGWLWNEERYTTRARQLVLRRAREAFKTEAGKDPDYSHVRSPLSIGIMGCPLAATADLLRPALSDAEWHEVVAHIREYYLAYARRPFFERAREHSPGFNKTLYGMCAVGLLALAVAEELPDDELNAAVSEAIRAAFGYLREAMDDDGGTYEGTGYGAICIHQAIQLGEALRRHGVPELSRYEPLRRHGHWLANLLAPKGGTINLGDSIGPDNIFASMLLLARWHDDPVLYWAYRRGLGRADQPAGPYGDSFNLWLANLPVQLAWFDPAAPTQSPADAGSALDTHAEGYGVITMRTGWEEQDLLAVLTGSGRRHTAAAHLGAEAGALNLWALGRELLYDPGYGYATADAHSMVVVTSKPPPVPGGNARHGGRSFRFARGPFAAMGAADMSQMLDCRWAERDVMLLRGAQPYLVVADDLNDCDNWSEYDWFWQASPGAEWTTPASDGFARIRNGDALLDIASFAPAADAYPKPYECTWFAETYKPEGWAAKPESTPPLQRLRMHMAAYNGILVSILVPRAVGAPLLSIRRLACPQPGVALTVEGPGFADTILFAPYNRFLQAGACTGSGRLAVVREVDGQPAAWALMEGYELNWNGQPLVPPRDRAGEVVSD